MSYFTVSGAAIDIMSPHSREIEKKPLIVLGILILGPLQHPVYIGNIISVFFYLLYGQSHIPSVENYTKLAAFSLKPASDYQLIRRVRLSRRCRGS